MVLLLPHASPAMAMLVGRLAADGRTAAVIPAASPPENIPPDNIPPDNSSLDDIGTGRSGTGTMIRAAGYPVIQSAEWQDRAWQAGDRP